MQRHDFDPIAFIFGLAFSGLGVLFMTGRLDLLNHAQWLWPGLLVLLGLAVLVGARGRGGARAPRPALEPRTPVDPALEDELLHGSMRSIDSEPLADTRSLFTLRLGGHTPQTGSEAAPAEEPAAPAAPAAAEEPTAAAEPAAAGEPAAAEGRAASEHQTEVLPTVDPDADTTLLPEPEPKREPNED